MAGHELKARHTKRAATNKDLLIEYIYKLECSFIFIINKFCSTVICKLIHYIFQRLLIFVFIFIFHIFMQIQYIKSSLYHKVFENAFWFSFTNVLMSYLHFWHS